MQYPDNIMTGAPHLARFARCGIHTALNPKAFGSLSTLKVQEPLYPTSREEQRDDGRHRHLLQIKWDSGVVLWRYLLFLFMVLVHPLRALEVRAFNRVRTDLRFKLDFGWTLKENSMRGSSLINLRTRDALWKWRVNSVPCPCGTRGVNRGFSNTNILLEFADGERRVLRVSPQYEQLTWRPIYWCTSRAKHRKCRSQECCGARRTSWWRAQGFRNEVRKRGAPCKSGRWFSGADCRQICEQLALVAAQIHKIRFAEWGLLGPAESNRALCKLRHRDARLYRILSRQPAFQRRDGVDRLSGFVTAWHTGPILHQPSWTHQLCHSDFNQKPTDTARRYGRYRLAAVLDWEFAFSASGVVDIGNLLRFEHESPAVESSWFADAYRAAGGRLDKWERAIVVCRPAGAMRIPDQQRRTTQDVQDRHRGDRSHLGCAGFLRSKLLPTSAQSGIQLH